MRTKMLMLTIMSLLGLSGLAWAADTEKKSTEKTTTQTSQPASDEFDALINPKTPEPAAPGADEPAPPQPPAGLAPPDDAVMPPPPGELPPLGELPPPNLDDQPGLGGPGSGPGGPGQMNRPMGRRGMGGNGPHGAWSDRMAGRRPLFEQVDPQTLISFLKENEPQLAEKLEKLQASDPEKFKKAIPAVSRTYAPVMWMMKRDPEMGKLACQVIRLRLKSEQLVQQYNDAATDNKTAIKDQLKQVVSDQFDAMIKQEQRLQADINTRVKAWAEKKQGADDKATENKIADKGDMKKPVRPRMMRAQERMEMHKKNLENWQQKRDLIIEQRLDQLLTGVEPFPWNRP